MNPQREGFLIFNFCRPRGRLERSRGKQRFRRLPADRTQMIETDDDGVREIVSLL